MTNSTEKESAQPENSNPANSAVSPGLRTKCKRLIYRTADKRPAIRVTSDGIDIDYFDFSRPDTLPFDIETYHDTQIFLGDYANPWYVDIESIEERYDEFGYGDPITDLVEKEHVTPSQKYKTYMNQGVLSDTFQAAALRSERMLYLLYIAVGIGVFNLLVLIT